MPSPRRLSDALKRDIFLISNQVQDFHYRENQIDYVWGKTIMRMILELQCVVVATIVTSQVWILTQYGSQVFESLIGGEIALPLLYLLSVIMGTVTYVRPTYWRIALSLTLYSVCIYFSMLVSNVGMRVLFLPDLAETLENIPKNSGLWIVWKLGFVLHMCMCFTSTIIGIISIRDMYTFNPEVMTVDEERKHVTSVVIPPTGTDLIKDHSGESKKMYSHPVHAVVYI